MGEKKKVVEDRNGWKEKEERREKKKERLREGRCERIKGMD